MISVYVIYLRLQGFALPSEFSSLRRMNEVETFYFYVFVPNIDDFVNFMQKLPNVKRLVIGRCEGLKSLPETGLVPPRTITVPECRHFEYKISKAFAINGKSKKV